MKLKIACLMALVVMAFSTEIMAAGSSKATSHGVLLDNLSSTAETGCVNSSKLSNMATPVDLYRGVAACIKEENYSNGAFLFAMAGVYGHYDIQRVEDRTGHQAIMVMLMGVLGGLDEISREKLSAEAQKMLDHPDNLRITCNEIMRLGAPGFYPSYMVNHGLKAFMGAEKSGLIQNFDAKSAWQKALVSYLHCPEK